PGALSRPPRASERPGPGRAAAQEPPLPPTHHRRTRPGPGAGRDLGRARGDWIWALGHRRWLPGRLPGVERVALGRRLLPPGPLLLAAARGRPRRAAEVRRARCGNGPAALSCVQRRLPDRRPPAGRPRARLLHARLPLARAG